MNDTIQTQWSRHTIRMVARDQVSRLGTRRAVIARSRNGLPFRSLRLPRFTVARILGLSG